MISEKQQNWKNFMMNEWLNNRIERKREREKKSAITIVIHFQFFFLFIDNRKNSTFLLSNMCRHHHQVFLLFVCPIYPFIIIIITNENFASSFIFFLFNNNKSKKSNVCVNDKMTNAILHCMYDACPSSSSFFSSLQNDTKKIIIYYCEKKKFTIITTHMNMNKSEKFSNFFFSASRLDYCILYFILYIVIFQEILTSFFLSVLKWDSHVRIELNETLSIIHPCIVWCR